MDECIFCKIVAGAIQAPKVYEDADVVAFLDNRPTSPGHTLVISKQHFDRFDIMPPAAVGTLFAAVRKIAPGVAQGAGASGYNLSVNVGAVAGQIVFHTHVHIIPRKSGDGLAPWGQRDYGSPAEAEQLAQKIRGVLKGA